MQGYDMRLYRIDHVFYALFIYLFIYILNFTHEVLQTGG